MNVTQAATQIRRWQHHQQQVVLVTGVFDILHIEHLRFLTKAKEQADYLIVGIETDYRVRQLKGTERPIHPLKIRSEQLRALKSVDTVFSLPKKFNSQSDWESLMQHLHPNIYAVSSHSTFLENKQYICDKFGIKFVIVHNHNPEFSTSKTESLILKHFTD